MKKLKVILCALMCLCMISIPFASSIVFDAGATDVNSIQDEIDELEKKSAEYQEILDNAEKDKTEKEAYGKTLVDKIEVMNQKVILIRQSIQNKEEEIQSGENALRAQIEALCTRLRSIYKAGNASNLEILLGAKSYSDFIDKYNLVKRLSNLDKKMIDDIKTQNNKLNEDKAELEQQEAALNAEIEDLDALVKENEAVLAEISSKSEAARTALMNSNSAISEREAEIAQYWAEQEEAQRKAAEEQAQREAAEQAARQAQAADQGSHSSSSSNNKPTESSGNNDDDDYNNDDDYQDDYDDTPTVTPSGSGYTWPCPGFYYLSSLWNEDRYTYNHGAIDIAGGGIMGAAVVAADSGTVDDTCTYCVHNWGKSGSCGCGGGYGNYVWINHGNGKETIYAHLTSVVVSPGQYVNKGDVIGYVGSTGYSTGPHLHFECRYNGVRYNPMNEF